MRLPSRQAMSRGLLAGFFIGAGVMHFVAPEPYEKITPGWVPYPREVVYLSGIAEAAGGAMVLIPRLRRFAGPYLIALLVAVFPANVQMALDAGDGSAIYRAIVYARLPLQVPLVLWALRVAGPQDRPGFTQSNGAG